LTGLSTKPEEPTLLPLMKNDQKSHHGAEIETSFPAKMGIKAIRFYQKWISPLLGANCRFQPTCSSYMLTAIERFGFLRGCLMGCWRILKCNPFCRGGEDPVPDRQALKGKRN
jgi:hypothetical protein